MNENGISIYDLPPEVLANLTDEEILEWATNNEEFNQAMDLRTQARKDLGMEPIPEIENTGKNTEINQTLNNNFINNKNKPIEKQIEDKKENQRQAHEKQRKEIENNHQETETKNIETQSEQKEKFNENQKSNKEISTNGINGSGGNGNKPPNTIDDFDIPDDGSKRDPKIRSERLKKAKSKKIKAGKGKYKVSPKAKNFKSIIANSMVNAVADEVDEVFKKASKEVFDEVFESGLYDIDGELNNWNWEKVNFKHPDQMSDIELANLDDDQFEELITFANGDKNKIEELKNRRGKGKAEKAYDNFMKENYYYNNSENTNPYKYDIPEYDFDIDENGNTKNIKPTGETNKIIVEDNKTIKRKAIGDMDLNVKSRSAMGMDDVFGWMKKHKIGMLDLGINLFSSVSDYKDSRRKGHGVVSSAARAAGTFVMGEMLGFWGGLGVSVLKAGGSLAIKGTELLYKENRRMNSAANNQVFGNAEFYDTQQLATMRQSGLNC